MCWAAPSSCCPGGTKPAVQAWHHLTLWWPRRHPLECGIEPLSLQFLMLHPKSETSPHPSSSALQLSQRYLKTQKGYRFSTTSYEISSQVLKDPGGLVITSGVLSQPSSEGPLAFPRAAPAHFYLEAVVRNTGFQATSWEGAASESCLWKSLFADSWKRMIHVKR